MGIENFMTYEQNRRSHFFFLTLMLSTSMTLLMALQTSRAFCSALQYPDTITVGWKLRLSNGSAMARISPPNREREREWGEREKKREGEEERVRKREGEKKKGSSKRMAQYG